MIINDRVYGKSSITAPVLISLIKSKPLQRLKGIAQYGVPDEYYIYKNYSRFEHSVGVMVLLKKLGATEEEQIAGLLHDVSHTAFSHIVDWVVGSGRTESFQDDKHKDFLNASEVSKILKKYGYSPKKISDYKHFGLLERPLPELCADRIDYSLREFPKDVARSYFLSLIERDGRIVVKDKKSAKIFAMNFLKRQKEHWEGFEAVSRYRIFADVLKISLDKKIITMEDFWREDKFVLKKLENSKDKDIVKILRVLGNKVLSNLPKSKKVSRKKFRYIDPLFIERGKLVRLSDVDKEFVNLIEKAKAKNDKGTTIPKI